MVRVRVKVKVAATMMETVFVAIQPEEQGWETAMRKMAVVKMAAMAAMVKLTTETAVTMMMVVVVVVVVVVMVVKLENHWVVVLS